MCTYTCAYYLDNLYKQSVETLEQCRRAWTADMEDACEVRAPGSFHLFIL